MFRDYIFPMANFWEISLFGLETNVQWQWISERSKAMMTETRMITLNLSLLCLSQYVSTGCGQSLGSRGIPAKTQQDTWKDTAHFPAQHCTHALFTEPLALEFAVRQKTHFYEEKVKLIRQGGMSCLQPPLCMWAVPPVQSSRPLVYLFIRRLRPGAARHVVVPQQLIKWTRFKTYQFSSSRSNLVGNNAIPTTDVLKENLRNSNSTSHMCPARRYQTMSVIYCVILQFWNLAVLIIKVFNILPRITSPVVLGPLKSPTTHTT